MSFTTRVLTWNIACLPKPWNSFGNKNPRDRKQSLLMYIKNLYPDILCLQEVFDSDVTNYLIRGLQSYGYEVVTSDEEYDGCGCCCAPGCLKSLGIGFRGGLLIAFKSALFQQVFAKFRKFSSSSGEDKFARKGVLSVRLISKRDDNEIIDVYTTHMQANAKHCFPGNNSQVRLSQLQELEKWVKEDPSGPETVIVAGDFNISPRDAVEYDRALEPTMRSLCLYGHLPIENITSPSTAWNDRVDYIYYYPKHKWGTADTTRSEIYKTELSDHYALLDEFKN